MARLESNFRNMVLVLSGITMFAALAIGSVYTLTKEPIVMAKIAKQQNAIKNVLPPYDHIDAEPVVKTEGLESTRAYRAYNEKNEFLGTAVETITVRGYSGRVGIIVGFDKAGKIIDYFVLEQNETPGLGAKMGVWFKTQKGKQNIKGMDPSVTEMNVKNVDAITAATISSKAFLGAIQNAYVAHLANIPPQK
ncbi:MAG: RnfABCDGE type electron transport complex subunit G [Paludibacter sp.]|nr:RnfABCDGE type electron transport complex subunit G [Paludibacter sp.]